jgi:chemotaxis protein CheX
MTFNSDEIFQIAKTIWETTLGRPIEAETSGILANRPRSMAACIQIAGAWNGAILLDCPIEVARLAASAMFSTDTDKLTVPDLQDAIAELVNMLGGNIKALLPGGCFLSLPAVVEGGDYSARVPGSRLINRIAFVCAGSVVSLTILEKIQEQSAAA